MYLIVIDGVMGSGKTLFMTLLANYLKSSGEKLGIHSTIYSNYEATGSKPFYTLHDFLDVKKQNSSLILLDESHMDLDSRSFSSNSVKYFTHMIFYLRKLRATMFLTSPLFSNLDSRVQALTNIYIHCDKDKKYFYYNIYDVQADRFIKTIKLKQEDMFTHAISLYQTNNFVVPLMYPDNKAEYEIFLNKLKSEEVLGA